jgi:exosortase/archaeosortase family protein
LQLGWQSLRGTSVEYFIVHTCTVSPATSFANLLTPNVHARAVQFSIRAPGGGLNILNGCEGLEALFLLMAAFATAPLPWRSRALGLLVGVPVVFAVNQVRILALFYAYRSDQALFDPLHGIVAPIVMILLVAGYFYAWLGYSARVAATQIG